MGSPARRLMTNQITQLGVVGCGWAGCRAIEAANATARLNVIAIAERDANRRAQAGDDNAVPHRYADYNELLENPDVEAVYLATSPDGRLQQVLDTLNASKHVLVQKPHAIRAPEILEMEAAAQHAGTRRSNSAISCAIFRTTERFAVLS